MDCRPTSNSGDRGVFSHRSMLRTLRKFCVVMLCALVTMSAQCDGAPDSFLWPPAKSTTSDITCWTCRNKANNEDCNDWAPDLRCPKNQTVCQTVHRFTTQDAVSVLVTKRCVHTSQCTRQHVGCSQDELTGQQECVSCCDYSYCNQEVPVNSSTALELSSFTAASTSSAWTAQPHCVPVILCILTTVCYAYHKVWTLFSWTS